MPAIDGFRLSGRGQARFPSEASNTLNSDRTSVKNDGKCLNGTFTNGVLGCNGHKSGHLSRRRSREDSVFVSTRSLPLTTSNSSNPLAVGNLPSGDCDTIGLGQLNNTFPSCKLIMVAMMVAMMVADRNVGAAWRDGVGRGRRTIVWRLVADGRAHPQCAPSTRPISPLLTHPFPLALSSRQQEYVYDARPRIPTHSAYPQHQR